MLTGAVLSKYMCNPHYLSGWRAKCTAESCACYFIQFQMCLKLRKPCLNHEAPLCCPCLPLADALRHLTLALDGQQLSNTPAHRAILSRLIILAFGELDPGSEHLLPQPLNLSGNGLGGGELSPGTIEAMASGIVPTFQHAHDSNYAIELAKNAGQDGAQGYMAVVVGRMSHRRSAALASLALATVSILDAFIGWGALKGAFAGTRCAMKALLLITCAADNMAEILSRHGQRW